MISYHRFFQIFLLITLLFFSNNTPLKSEEISPVAQNGVLDLRHWDFKTDGTVSLKGEWQFFWNQLLTPENISSKRHLKSARHSILPGIWNHIKIDGEKIGSHGYATYSLTILHNHAGTPIAFKIKEMSSAYSLFLDGKLISSNGKVGRTKPETIPEYRPATVNFTPKGDQIQVVLHISNFNLKEAGPIKEIILGNVQQVHTQNQNWQVINLIVIGLILAMGLYHLSLYLLMRKYLSNLYFGLFCCMVSLRSALTNDRILHALIPSISWENLVKLEYLSFYMAVPVFIWYIVSLFPKDFSKRILILSNCFAAIFSAVVMLTLPDIFSYTLTAYQIFTVLLGLYLIYIFSQAHKQKREGIKVIAFGFIILFLCVLYDILGANYIIQSDYSLHIGLFIFIFSQAYLLSVKFSKTMKRVEKQKNQLIESHQQFQNSRIALILGLAKLAEYRDEDTGSHLERIREYSKCLAIELAKKKEYKYYISEEYINDLYQSSILHDIGKVAIQDAILLKPGKLTDEEFEIIKTHATIGGDTIAAIESNSKVRSFLTLGRNIAYYHHEKWNGKGYPEGLKSKDIPLSARITAIADVYDALTSERPYKKAFSHEKSVEIIIKDSGTHFDPDIIDAFKKLTYQFKHIRNNFFD